METAMYLAGGALLVLGVARRILRSARPHISVAPLSDQWLAEQKLTRHGYSS